MCFPKRLRHLRISRHLMQKEVAESLGVTETAISQWERGMRVPDINTLTQLADIFMVTTDYLLGRSDDPCGKIIRLESISKDLPSGYMEVITSASEANLTGDELEAIVNIIKTLKQK